MVDLNSILIAGSDLQEFSNSFTAACQALPRELRLRLRKILTNYFGWYGFDGAYTRMNRRTVAQVFAEYQSQDIEPIASGSADGVEWRLYGGSTDQTSE